MFTSLLFANSLDDVEKDVQCFLNYGYRPISYGIDKYINSQGNFQDLGYQLLTCAILSTQNYHKIKV